MNEKPETINEASETSAADQTFELKSEHGSSSIIEQNDEEAKDFSSIESNNDTSKDKEGQEEDSKGDVSDVNKPENTNTNDNHVTSANLSKEIHEIYSESNSVDIRDIERISKQLIVEEPKAQENEVHLAKLAI